MHWTEFNPMPQAISLFLFTDQDPLKILPSQEKYPSWKVKLFLHWIEEISGRSWRLETKGSMDKTNTGFKGWYPDKLRIIYKRRRQISM